MPRGAKWYRKCCTQAKLAFPTGGDAVLPTLVVPQPLPAPVRNVEWRIGEDVVGPQVGVPVVVEAVAVGDLTLDAPDGQVHPGQTPGCVVGLLAVNGNIALGPTAVAVARGVGADELHRLDEHAGGAAAGIVDPALVGLQHFHQQPHHGARSVELATLAALGDGELLQEVFVHLPQHIVSLGPRPRRP